MKYQRTYHLSFSNVEDDSKFGDFSHLEGKDIIVTEKMDGENTGITNKLVHARSLDSNNHPSRNWVKGFASNFQYLMKDEEKIFGENLYAAHSVKYESLLSYFYGFALYKGDICSSWDDTVKYFADKNIISVPVLYRGIFNNDKIREIFNSLDLETSEGIVVRNADSFHYNDFEYNVFKAVRQNHVITDQHWTTNWEKNNLFK